jgi:c-di-GMP-related signal transduction protein
MHTQFFPRKNTKETYGRELLKWVLREIGYEGLVWIERAQDKIQWQAFVNAVINRRSSTKIKVFIDQPNNVMYSKKTTVLATS